jgi:hypothetical protein
MIKEWLNRTADRGFGFLAALLMRRAVAPLARFDEASLREAGLSRSALAAFLATPLGTDPGAFFTLRRQQAGTVAPEQSLAGQPDARAGPKRRRNRRRSRVKRMSSKSTLSLAKETP